VSRFDVESLLAAFRCEPTGEIPFWDVLFGFPPNLAEDLLGRPLEPGPDRVGQLQDYTAEDQLELAGILGISVIGFRAGWSFGGDIWVDGEGGLRRYVGGRIKSPHDLKDLPQLDLEGPRRKLEKFQHTVAGTGAGVFVGLHGIFHDVIQSVGYDDFLVAVHDAPGFVEQLLDISLERNRRVVEALAPLRPTFLRFYEDVAYNRGLMIRPSLFREMWLRRVLHLTEPARALGIPVTLHCCGKLDQMIPLAIEAGFAAIDPFEPECNDIDALYSHHGGRICFMGNVGVKLLAEGPAEEIAAFVARQAGRLGRHGGYVIKSGNHYAEDVPAAHVLALAQAARELPAQPAD
jgi:hypothetical protein